MNDITYEKKNILITSVGGYGSQVYKSIESIECYSIYVSDMNPNQLKGFDRNKVFYSLPANSEDYIPKLLEFCVDNSIDAIIPGNEKELSIISSMRSKFEKVGVFLLISNHDTIRFLDKNYLLNRLKEEGLARTKFYFIHNESDINNVLYYPVVIKPTTISSGSKGIYLAQSYEELASYYHLLRIKNDFPSILVQDYFGNASCEYTVGILNDLEGNYINSIALKRNLSLPLSISVAENNRTDNSKLGEILVISSGLSQGDFVNDSNVLNQCIEISKRLKLTGSVNIQCRLIDDHVEVFEINPRFSGTTFMRSKAGYNEVDLLLKKYLYSKEIDVNFPYNFISFKREVVEVPL